MRTVSQEILQRRAQIIANYRSSASMAQTAKLFGISRERVRQIVAKYAPAVHAALAMKPHDTPERRYAAARLTDIRNHAKRSGTHVELTIDDVEEMLADHAARSDEVPYFARRVITKPFTRANTMAVPRSVFYRAIEFRGRRSGGRPPTYPETKAASWSIHVAKCPTPDRMVQRYKRLLRNARRIAAPFELTYDDFFQIMSEPTLAADAAGLRPRTPEYPSVARRDVRLGFTFANVYASTFAAACGTRTPTTRKRK